MLLPQSVFISPPFAETEAVLVRSSLEHKPYIAEEDGAWVCKELALPQLPAAVLCLASLRGQHMVMRFDFSQHHKVRPLKIFTCHQDHYHVRCHHLLPFRTPLSWPPLS